MCIFDDLIVFHMPTLQMMFPETVRSGKVPGKSWNQLALAYSSIFDYSLPESKYESTIEMHDL